MRYENNLSTNLALLDLPVYSPFRQTESRAKRISYFERIFKQLAVYDKLNEDEFSGVLSEAIISLESDNPGFEVIFPTAFERYVSSSRHFSRWQKLAHDYNYYLERESKRRNKGNPYHPQDIYVKENWEELPDFSRQQRNLPWQFDSLNRDAQVLAGQVYELTKSYDELEDRDLFRARINSILVPERIIFALSGESAGEFESQTNLLNLKLDLDGYKQAYLFLGRLIESLSKIKWKEQNKVKQLVGDAVEFAENLQTKLKNRIIEAEKRYLLFSEYDPGVEED